MPRGEAAVVVSFPGMGRVFVRCLRNSAHYTFYRKALNKI